MRSVADNRADRDGGKVHLAGVAFDNLTMSEAIARIDERVRGRTPSLVVTPNVDHMVRIRDDREYANVVRQADLVLADGQPIVWVSRLLGRGLKERVPGSDLLPQLCGWAAEAGYRVFFLGGDAGAADRARDVLVRRYPGLQVVGTYCPPYGFESSPQENAKAISAVREAHPDILFVGLGSPKQERWIAAHMDEYQVPVSIGVGISFSFVAGDVKRAPRWVQRAGLEWLHRLYCEPHRLWRRYILRGPSFFPIVIREMAATWGMTARRILQPSRGA